MKNKMIKKMTYIIPVIVGLFVMYGAISGKLEKAIDSIKVQYQTEIESSKKTESNKETEKEIPVGKINLYEWFDNWDIKPSVEIYDPQNKIPYNGVYGVTMDELSYKTDLYKAQEKLKNTMKIPSEYIGSGIFNKDKIINWNTTFDIKHTQASYKYSNLVIRNEFNGLNTKYYTEDKHILIDMLDENGKLTGATMVNFETDEVVVDVECRLVMFDIMITPHSDWVMEEVSVPELVFLQVNGNSLEYLYKYYSSYGELDIISCYPIYYDLGLYDVETARVNDNIYYCPMRKGERIKFRVGYIVPLELIDYAYFVFNPNCYIATDFSYATDDIAIFKVTEGE